MIPLFHQTPVHTTATIAAAAPAPNEAEAQNEGEPSTKKRKVVKTTELSLHQRIVMEGFVRDISPRVFLYGAAMSQNDYVPYDVLKMIREMILRLYTQRK